MRQLVEELQKLVKQKVIGSIQYADWVAPIVPFLKSDKKTVWICSNFSTTVNKASCLDSYPMPRVEDILAKLKFKEGKNFSKTGHEPGIFPIYTRFVDSRFVDSRLGD